MRLSRQLHASFFFLYENILSVFFPLLEVFYAQKAVTFAVFCCLFVFLLVVFGLICVFVGSKSFRKKSRKLSRNCLDSLIYYTTSGLYIKYNSYEAGYIETAWVRDFYGSTHKICSKVNIFQKQVAHIKKLRSWLSSLCP